MAYDTWGGSWGNSWAISWTRGGTPPAATSQLGGRNWTESERALNARLRRLALQQARLEDDEEALALLLASIIRR